MTEEELLTLAREALRLGRYSETFHLGDRRSHRNVRARDIKRAIGSATRAALQPNGTWRIFGKDCDGDDLTVVLRLDGESILIITVF